MKVVIIGDTHNRHRELGTLHGDILIHCGDICDVFQSRDRELESIDHWFSKQQFSKTLCIGGNHDHPLQRRAAGKDPVFENAVYLQDELFEFGGFKFYGSSWVPDLLGWAYYQPEGVLAKKWEQLPLDTDILITHTPPYGILDSSRHSSGALGCRHLRDRVRLVRPRVHCFGHIHASYGIELLAGTTFINASIVSGRHMNVPISVHLD
jgi:Icc-related predicted phosphoesterase